MGYPMPAAPVRRRVRLCVALFTALGLLPWLQLASAQAEDEVALKFSVPTITTSGTATTEVVPDIATISIGVETERPKAADAARENARAAQAVINALKAQGVEAKDIKTVSVTLTPVYDETADQAGRVTKRTLRGYKAHNSLSVRVKDIEKAGALAGQLIDKGANYFGGMEFDYSQKEAKYDALRTDAVRDAERKANSYVRGLGLKLGRVIEIVTEPREVFPAPRAARVMTAAAAEGGVAIPVEPGVETLRADVQITWELAQ